MQIVYFTINFIIFALLLIIFLRRPVSKFLGERKIAFIKDSTSSKSYYDGAFNRLEEIKGKLLDIEKDGAAHIDRAAKQAKDEARVIITNAKNYSNNMLISSKDMIMEEVIKAKNEKIINFVHSVVVKTKNSVKEHAGSKEYDELYMKDYFSSNQGDRI